MKGRARVRLIVQAGFCISMVMIPAASRGQGIMDKLGRASQSFAAGAAELSMAGATKLNLENRGIAPIQWGTVTFSVAAVDVKDSIGVRVHAYFYNATEQPVTIQAPNMKMFALVDAKGRRLVLLSVKVKDLAKGAAELTVPALERVEVNLLFRVPDTDSPEAILKLATAGMIHGIPLSEVSAPAAPAEPAAPVAPAPVPPKDSVRIQTI